MSFPRYRTRFQGVTQEYLGRGMNVQYPSCTWLNPILKYTLNRRPPLEETCHDFVNPGPPYKVGYEFLLKRRTAEYIDSESVQLQASYYKYDGKFAIEASVAEVDAAYASYGASAASWGASAFKRFRPVQPRTNLGQALGELRDFPSLFKVALKRFCDLGSAYLNYQFGWRPFIKDLLDFIKVQKKIENHIRYVRRNNNKWIKRNGTLRDSTSMTTTQVSGGYMIPGLNSALARPIGSVPKVQKTLIIKDRIWFEAMMKYYIPRLSVDSCESIWTSKLLRKLYGFEITPSLLWKLTPWTWLADWVSNVGDVYDNITNQAYDNLVAKYAYVMRHQQTSVVFIGTLATRSQVFVCEGGIIKSFPPETPGPSPTARAVFTAECKERAKATQWGFGNEGASISPRQLAILVALGIQQMSI